MSRFGNTWRVVARLFLRQLHALKTETNSVLELLDSHGQRGNHHQITEENEHDTTRSVPAAHGD
ncbi:hypothetical protein V6Z12_A13G184400 [Gossypium hirsutum]